MNNLLSYCGLVEMRINASDKDLPVRAKKVPSRVKLGRARFNRLNPSVSISSELAILAIYSFFSTNSEIYFILL